MNRLLSIILLDNRFTGLDPPLPYAPGCLHSGNPRLVNPLAKGLGEPQLLVLLLLLLILLILRILLILLVLLV